MEEKQTLSAKRIVALLSRPRRLFFSILAGNTLVNIAASACATIVAIQAFGERGVMIAIGFMMIVLLLFGEIVPKNYAYLFAERWARAVAYPLSVVVRLLTPIQMLIHVITDNLINRLGFIVPKDRPDISEDEIKSLIKIGHREGVVEDDEKEMLYGVFDFKGLHAKEIMTPKIDVRSIDFDWSVNEVAASVKEAKHSRLPVYRDSIDNVVGVVYAKDVLFSPGTPIKDVMKEPFFVPEAMRIDRLLADLQKRAIQMAIVKDEYGVTTGIVTMEDILEEIVGEIVDEYDKEEPAIVQQGEARFRISGLLNINDANERLGLGIGIEEVDTMGGFAEAVLQKIPKEGEEFSYGRFRYRVAKVEGFRVKELVAERL